MREYEPGEGKRVEEDSGDASSVCVADRKKSVWPSGLRMRTAAGLLSLHPMSGMKRVQRDPQAEANVHGVV